MSNKTIPLRRVSRRKYTNKMQQAHELSLQINANAQSTTAVMKLGGRIIHRRVDRFEPKTFPSGGIVLNDDAHAVQEFEILGWTPEDGKRYRQLIEEAIDEYKAEPGLIPNTIQIHDAKWGHLRTEWGRTPIHPLDIDPREASSCADLPPVVWKEFRFIDKDGHPLTSTH